MATLSSFRTELQAKINRRDLTNALTDLFIRDAIARLNEELRIPAMEASANAVADAGGGFSRIDVPADYLETIRVLADDLELAAVPYTTFLRYEETSGGTPRVYAHRNGKIYIRPYASDTLTLDYYQKIADLVDDADTNVILDDHPHLLRLAAQVFAAEHFRMQDQLLIWEQHYQAVRDRLNDNARNASYSGGTMQVQPITGGYYG